MITVKDYKDNEYTLLSVKTITEELNGNHSLELKIPQQKNNSLDLLSIDKLWEINYQNVDYKIIFIKKITKGDSFYLDVRAIPLFYFEMDKQIIHESKDGHYTAKNALDIVFNGSGYQCILVDFVDSLQIDGFGKGETRLEMFKRLIERLGLEFYIVGKTVYLKKLIGNDTNFIYKYKLNVSNISQSIDASGFFTHISGFGNFEEGSDDYLKEAKLKREYTSPLASIVGKYEGKPIIDGRIKDVETMDMNLKKMVEDSLEISIDGNLHDIRSIYDKAVPVIGDRVFLIDERINLEQEIRVQSLKNTYDVNDNLIDCEVTFGSRNIKERYKSNLNSAAKNFTALMKGDIKLPMWSLDEVARGMITKIHASENELKYGDFGIQAIDKNNPNHVFGLNSQGWYISTDGGRTARTIATSEGVVAESIIGNHLIGLQLTSPGQNGYFHVAGNYAEFVNNVNNKKMSVRPEGLYGYDADGVNRFRVDAGLVTSAAIGTNNTNVYLGSMVDGEIRAVNFDDIPGDGSVYSYRYRPVRALEYFGNRLSVNHGTNGVNLYLSPLANGEIRVTHNESTNVYRPLRASKLYGDALHAHEGDNLYLGANGEIRAVGKDNVNVYRNVRGAWALFNALDVNTGTHLYIRPVSNGEVRVTTKGTTNSYKAIRASEYLPGSYHKYKSNIREWNYDVLSVIKTEFQAYQYILNNDENKRVRHGSVVGGGYKIIPEFVNKDGVDLYEMTTWALRGVQQLAFYKENIDKEIEDLKSKIEKLEDIIHE